MFQDKYSLVEFPTRLVIQRHK
ncbi:hypothetical protein MTR67_019487 [Solanum verrucosum]|uniref:Uncharacterized protein n=1 Tax=Solanum verrucosum TaxID=315347 RepID=A0AAF0QNU1_SOLVR|nr:hypothetical protein MTR67_019487 [Solanum verrucosum]